MRGLFLILTIAILGAAQAHAQLAPIESYGLLPTNRAFAISPNGKVAAFIRREGEQEAFVVYDLETKEMIHADRTDRVKARWVFFINDRFVALTASRTTDLFGYRGRFENSSAYVVDLQKGGVKKLLAGNEQLYPAQSGLGRVVGFAKEADHIYMPGFAAASGRQPPYALFRVNVRNNKASIASRGNANVTDWLIDLDGEVYAREEYDQASDLYQIRIRTGKTWTVIFEEKTPIPNRSLLGLKAGSRSLVVSARDRNSEHVTLAELTPEGELLALFNGRDDADIDSVISDPQRQVLGVRYSGVYPVYEFFDDEPAAIMTRIQQQFPQQAVRLVDWRDGFQDVVVHVAGGGVQPAYYIYNHAKSRLLKVVPTYESIPTDAVSNTFELNYKARDGVPIPSILTASKDWGPGQSPRPLIMMPHGGPEAYDQIGFDWLAQYFASRGYLVVQPNFRGSSGYGRSWRNAGFGQWGTGVMQHDVSDGVNALIKNGWADPERVCIIGASYGGYAALAGGAFTPDLYQCVGAFAPVSDLFRMLIAERREHGEDSWVLAYWQRYLADLENERPLLESISPVLHAEAFKAPVLLIHGNDDVVVPIRQSYVMRDALNKAGKDVTFAKLKGGDHWLSTSEMRLDMLRALDAFVAEHIGPHPIQ